MAKINITNQDSTTLPLVDSGKSFLYVDSVTKKAMVKDDAQAVEAIASESVVDSKISAAATPFASNAEVIAGTVETKAVSPKTLKDNYWINSNVATWDVVVATYPADLNTNATVYTKMKQYTVGVAGVYKVKFWVTAQSWYIMKWRVYKNWVALWTEISNWQTSIAYRTEDLTFDKWDTIEFWWYNSAAVSWYLWYITISIDKLVNYIY